MEKAAYGLMCDVYRSSLIMLIEIEYICQNVLWTLLKRSSFVACVNEASHKSGWGRRSNSCGDLS
jgi:hypothetical protein